LLTDRQTDKRTRAKHLLSSLSDVTNYVTANTTGLAGQSLLCNIGDIVT